MITLTPERIKRLSENGYTVFRIGQKCTFVRLYSRFCSSSFLKRHCIVYKLVKVGEGDEKKV